MSSPSTAYDSSPANTGVRLTKYIGRTAPAATRRGPSRNGDERRKDGDVRDAAAFDVSAAVAPVQAYSRIGKQDHQRAEADLQREEGRGGQPGSAVATATYRCSR